MDKDGLKLVETVGESSFNLASGCHLPMVAQWILSTNRHTSRRTRVLKTDVKRPEDRRFHLKIPLTDPNGQLEKAKHISLISAVSGMYPDDAA